MSRNVEPGEAGVWVFNGGGTFPAAVFPDQDSARRWIATARVSGTLTWYPLGISAYDWAISRGLWSPTRDEQRTPAFIARFSSGYAPHFHFEDGQDSMP